MRSNLKDKANRMRAADCRVLSALGREMLVRLGFVCKRASTDFDEFVGHSERFDTELSVSFFADVDRGHPWLGCQFQRAQARLDLPWDATENQRPFAAIREALGEDYFFSLNGKCNCHVFERLTVDQALERFEAHLRRLGPFRPPDHGESVKRWRVVACAVDAPIDP